MRRFLRGLLVTCLVMSGTLGVGWGIVEYFNLRSMTVTSGSMWPILVPGSRIIIREDVPIHRNDIIAFHNPETGEVTTHIFGGFNPDGTLMTRGNANEDPDKFEFVPAPTRSDVIGKMVAHTEAFTTDFWTTRRGIAILLLALAGTILLVFYHLLGRQPRSPVQEDTSVST